MGKGLKDWNEEIVAFLSKVSHTFQPYNIDLHVSLKSPTSTRVKRTNFVDL